MRIQLVRWSLAIFGFLSTFSAQASAANSSLLLSDLSPAKAIILATGTLTQPGSEQGFDRWYKMLTSIEENTSIPVVVVVDQIPERPVDLKLIEKVRRLNGRGDYKILEVPASGEVLQWARDWFPRSTTQGLLAYTSRGTEVQTLTAQALNIPLAYEIDPMMASASTSHGGNLIVTPSGDCMSAYSESEGDRDKFVGFHNFINSLGCRQIIKLPPLPLDATKHVDIFLQLVGPKTLVLGRWDDSYVLSSDLPNSFMHGQCSFLERKCTDKNVLMPKTGTLRFATYSSLKNYIENLAQTRNIVRMEIDGLLQVGHLNSGTAFADHYVKVKKILEDHGYQVLTLDQPSPVMGLALETAKIVDQTEPLERTSSLPRSVFSEHLDQLDKFKLGETYAWVILSKPIVPTYINNLIVGNTVFLPTYDTYASTSQNSKAIDFYSRLFKVVRIDGADPMIRAQGAVHCLTNTVH